MLTAAYTAGAKAVVSSLVICNRDPDNSAKIRVSVAVGGAADDSKQYLYYDLDVDAADTFIATIGVTMAAHDVIRVYTDNATVSFNFFGVEVT